MAAKLTLLVDKESFEAAQQAVGDKHDLVAIEYDAGTCVLSSHASFFPLEWWGDAKLVEAALKRARAEKRKAK